MMRWFTEDHMLIQSVVDSVMKRISDSHILWKTTLSLEKYLLPIDTYGLLAIFEWETKDVLFIEK